jgi:pyruvate ferredoxin oxidoreductase gamma subunit
MDDETFMKDMETSLADKFASKPQVIKGNMDAFERALKEVKGL